MYQSIINQKEDIIIYIKENKAIYTVCESKARIFILDFWSILIWDGSSMTFLLYNKSYQVLECQNNVKPISSTYNEENHTIRANFNKEICNGCPYKDKCAILTSPKNSNTFVTTIEKLNNAEQKAKMNDTEYQKLSNTRTAIEGIPSVMRRRYHIDDRDRANKGKVYLKMDFSASMLSINIKRASKMAGSMLNNVTFLINFLFKKFFHKKSSTLFFFQ